MVVPDETFAALRRKASEDPLGGENSWDAYAVILVYLNEAAARVPGPEAVATMDEEKIDQVLEVEIEQLAVLALKLFPRGGMAEFASYIPRKPAQ